MRYATDIAMVTMECGECGIVFAVTDAFYWRCKNEKQSWHCPNGHGRIFSGPTEADRLREQLQREQIERASAEGYAKELERSRSAIRGQLTKLKNRVGRGVCPCCNRTFQNLGKHIKGQHPQFLETE